MPSLVPSNLSSRLLSLACTVAADVAGQISRLHSFSYEPCCHGTVATHRENRGDYLPNRSEALPKWSRWVDVSGIHGPCRLCRVKEAPLVSPQFIRALYMKLLMDMQLEYTFRTPRVTIILFNVFCIAWIISIVLSKTECSGNTFGCVFIHPEEREAKGMDFAVARGPSRDYVSVSFAFEGGDRT